jgi:peroxiredoxin
MTISCCLSAMRPYNAFFRRLKQILSAWRQRNRTTVCALAAFIIGIAVDSGFAQDAAAQSTSQQRNDTTASDLQGQPVGRVELRDGDSAIGQLLPSSQDGIVRWQADGFTQPFDFALDAVQRIAVGPSTNAPPADEFGCVLRSGNCVYGRLAGLSAETVLLRTEADQLLELDRQQVERLVRASSELRMGRRINSEDPGRRTPWQFDSSGNRWKLATPTPAINVRAAAPGNDPFGVPAADRGEGADDAPAGDDVRAQREQAERQARILLFQRLRQESTKESNSTGHFIDLDLAPKCLVELDLSWENTPLQFNLALGIEHSHQSLKRAIRLAVWDGQVVIARELNFRMSLVPILSIKELLDRRLQLMIYLDQAAGHVMICDRSGKLLGELTAAPENDQQPGPGVRLLTWPGTQLDQLSAMALDWNPQSVTAAIGGGPHLELGSPHLVLDSGQIIQGDIQEFNVATATVSVEQTDTTQSYPLDQIEQLILPSPTTSNSVPIAAEAQATAELYHLVTGDGWSLRGRWLGVEADRIVFQVSGVDDPVQVLLHRLESLNSLSRDPAPIERSAWQLTTDAVRLKGRIAAGDPEAAVPQFQWHPDASQTAASLTAPVDGEIEYQSPAPQLEAIAAQRIAPQRQAGGLGGALLDIFGAQPQQVQGRRVLGNDGRIVIVRDAPAPAANAHQATLFLQTGDTISCKITRIDDRGIAFVSPETEHGFARHDQVKSVILAALIQPKAISEATRQRLLMVPRSRRDDPPTHLICSRNGDFLRGRLIGLDDEFLQMEVRLETRSIPRNRVAQIFWLHPDADTPASDLGSEDQADVANEEPITPADLESELGRPDSASPLRMQALRRDGTRITFDYQGFRNESVLVGHHEILGNCEIELKRVSRLLLDKAIERSMNNSPLARWRLHNAPIPRAFLPGAGDAGGAADGTESTLVGKPAPGFELELLSGEKFRLADHRGRVVVLDFWASWCGPCIQAMPQIDAVVREFSDTDVQLVAINLQEQAAAITAALERMELDVTVALDRNGAVADQYGVTAIPQTVIVGPTGDVARLYVGINASTAKQMREAIEELLQSDAPQENVQK